MSESPRAYVPADPVCLGVGIGCAFAGVFVQWLLLGAPFGFAMLSLGVLAAVGGMVLAGVCARLRERDLLGPGRRPALRGEGKGPAGSARDPLRRMDERMARTTASDHDGRGQDAPGDRNA